MKNIIKISSIILLLVSNSVYSQDLYKWSNRNKTLSNNQELYLWTVQLEKEYNKKIVKKISAKYDSAIEEIEDLIKKSDSTNYKNIALLRNIFFLNLSNAKLKTSSSEYFNKEIRTFDNIFNKVSDDLKLTAIDFLANDKKNEAEFILRDLYTVDSTNQSIKELYLENLKAIVQDIEKTLLENKSKLKAVNSTRDLTELNTAELNKIITSLKKIGDSTEIKNTFSGRILAKKSDKTYATVTLSNKQKRSKIVGFKFNTIKELVFLNQSIFEDNYKEVFGPKVIEVQNTLKDFEKSNVITMYDLAADIFIHDGKISPELRAKFFKKNNIFYYYDGYGYYEVKEKNNITSFQFRITDYSLNINYQKDWHLTFQKFIIRSFKNMRVFTTTHPALFPEITKPTSFYDVISDGTQRAYEFEQSIIVLVKTHSPSKSRITGNPTSEVTHQSFNYLKVKKLANGGLLNIKPKLMLTGNVIKN